jgi:hypothetical protein
MWVRPPPAVPFIAPDSIAWPIDRTLAFVLMFLARERLM